MRSDVPKVLHRVCGKPMVEWVVDAARDGRRQRVVCVVRPGDGVAEGLPEGVEVAEQSEGEGTGAAVLAARDAVERRARSSSSRATTRSSRPSRSRTCSTSTARRRGAAPRSSPPSSSTRPATAASSATATAGRADRRDQVRRPGARPTSSRSARSTSAPTCSRRPALFDALDAVGDRGRRALPHRRFPAARARTGVAVVTSGPTTLDARLGVNDRADLMEAEELAQRRILEHHARDGVTFLHPATHQGGGRRRDRRGHRDRPGREPARRHQRRRGLRDRPAHDRARLADRRRRQRRALLPRRGGGRRARHVGPFAYLRPGTVIARGRQGRHLRRGQELGHRRGRQGAAPLLHRRRRRRRGSNLGASTITANYDGRRSTAPRSERA